MLGSLVGSGLELARRSMVTTTWGGWRRRHPVALSTEFLAEQPIFQVQVAGQPFVVMTSESGASRVYESAGRQFDAALDERRVRDDDGLIWLLTEDELPAHRAFWFGWCAQFPQTTVFD